jgi:hypothetical protein
MTTKAVRTRVCDGREDRKVQDDGDFESRGLRSFHARTAPRNAASSGAERTARGRQLEFFRTCYRGDAATSVSTDEVMRINDDDARSGPRGLPLIISCTYICASS